MKNKDLKKGRESIIGKIIYGFLLFMPLLAITTTCLYTIFNKNAYKSYSGLNENEADYTQITTKTDLQVDKQYTLINAIGNEAVDNTANTQRIYFNVEKVENYSGNYNLMSAKSCGFYSANANTLYYYFYDTNNTLIGGSPLTQNNNFKITFTYESNTINNNNLILEKIPTIYSITYNNNAYINNAFYYSIEQVEQSNLFNWAENSLIYTGIENTCTQLAITTPFIPLLLAYWLIISVIYFLYDIALMLVWIIHRKIHEMQESI